jgi:hypothetical protein
VRRRQKGSQQSSSKRWSRCFGLVRRRGARCSFADEIAMSSRLNSNGFPPFSWSLHCDFPAMHHACKIHFSPVSSHALVLLFKGEMSRWGRWREKEREECKRGKAHLRPFVSTRPTIKVRQETQGLAPHASPCILTHLYAGTYISTLQAYLLFLKANLHFVVLSARCSSIRSAHRLYGHGESSVFTHTGGTAPRIHSGLLHCPKSPEPGLF